MPRAAKVPERAKSSQRCGSGTATREVPTPTSCTATSSPSAFMAATWSGARMSFMAYVTRAVLSRVRV